MCCIWHTNSANNPLPVVARTIEYTKTFIFRTLYKTAVNSESLFFCFVIRGAKFACIGYLCDDFLNKHKRLIIEEFEAGFVLTLISGEPNFLFTLFRMLFAFFLPASCYVERWNTREEHHMVLWMDHKRKSSRASSLMTRDSQSDF